MLAINTSAERRAKKAGPSTNGTFASPFRKRLLHLQPMKNAAAAIRRNVIRLARGLRDVWLIIGVTISLFVLIEFAFRSQRLVWRYMADSATESSPSSMPANPFEANPWWKDYWADHQREEHVAGEPYVYLRNPTFTGNVMTVDRIGHRVTPLLATIATRPLRVFFFGGSTMFGGINGTSTRSLPRHLNAFRRRLVRLRVSSQPISAFPAVFSRRKFSN